MKNFDTIMRGMTIERLAEMGVKLVNINGRENYYMTSTGQLYTMNEYDAAVRHEYDWLCYDPNPEKAQEQKTETVVNDDADKAPKTSASKKEKV